MNRPRPAGRPLSALILILSVSLAACQTEPSAPANGTDPEVKVTLANTGGEPLRCRLMFGHWVDRDLGFIAPDDSVSFMVTQQAADGALYVMRSDGQRRMMIENILCAIDGDWQATVGQVDLGPARSTRESGIAARCALPPSGGRVTCPPIRLER